MKAYRLLNVVCCKVQEESSKTFFISSWSFRVSHLHPEPLPTAPHKRRLHTHPQQAELLICAQQPLHHCGQAEPGHQHGPLGSRLHRCASLALGPHAVFQWEAVSEPPPQCLKTAGRPLLCSSRDCEQEPLDAIFVILSSLALLVLYLAFGLFTTISPLSLLCAQIVMLNEPAGCLLEWVDSFSAALGHSQIKKTKLCFVACASANPHANILEQLQ